MSAIANSNNISQRMANKLGRAIISGEYTEHTGLPTEADLCALFNASRTAVREAIKMLTAKGLIVSKPRMGIRVLPVAEWNLMDPDLLAWSAESHPSLHLIHEYLQLCLAILAEGAYLAAKNASKAVNMALDDALVQLRQAEKKASRAAVVKSEINVYVAILSTSGNRFYYYLRDFVSTAFIVLANHPVNNKEQVFQASELLIKVVDAIKQGQADEAKTFMYRLVQQTMAQIGTNKG